METFEDMKALAMLCEQVGNEKAKQIVAIRTLMNLSLPKAAELWSRLVLAGMVKHGL